jgi:hypothetical protein
VPDGSIAASTSRPAALALSTIRRILPGHCREHPSRPGDPVNECRHHVHLGHVDRDDETPTADLLPQLLDVDVLDSLLSIDTLLHGDDLEHVRLSEVDFRGIPASVLYTA